MPGRKPTPKELDAYQGMLLRMRGMITGDMSRLEEDAFGIDGEKAGVDNKADSGSDSYSMEFSLELLRMDNDSLRRIDDALERLEQESFGRCSECDSWIAKGRLMAVPYAENCIGCQRAQEAS
jgi:RNA polymerase-binding transcription factor DksA